ncbi:biopolymer transport protein ExbD [Mesonia hippocampi]|uniref:Biopolymer transport protein ExbD n=1 Tax=Mesonia hippocampi TaxID=1628250 RepID=A0A840ENH2_9FLAO|nr:hypothetical protein [Mesonia hippocampi]MBB4119668.1 biopolymer transport protein ExbD [Mesonia hippocampi]
MKNILKYIFLIFIFSCSPIEQKEKLLGNWYAYSNDKDIIEFQFYNDSLIIYDMMLGRYSQEWKVNKNNIFLTHIKGFTDKKQLTYSYTLDKSNELLNLEVLGDTIIQLPELRKAKNTFDFFRKTIDLEIELPECNDELKNISQPKRLNFNIYAGFKHKNFIVKTDSSTDLKNLEKEVTKFKNNTRNELKKFLRFNLIADKNITHTQLDSIKNRLEETSIKITFRTYKNSQIDYKDNLIWFGKKE